MIFSAANQRSRRRVAIAIVALLAACAGLWAAGRPLDGRTSNGVNVAGHYIPIDPAGYLYVTNLTQTSSGVTTAGNTISVYRESSNDVVANLTVGHAPKGIDVSFTNQDSDDPAPDASEPHHVYVANSADNTVTVLNDLANPAANTVAWTAAVGRSPWGVGVDQQAAVVAVSNNADNSVTFLDADENQRLGTTTLPVVGGKTARPQQVTVDQKSHTAYVANPGNGTVTALNTRTRGVVASIAVPGTPVFDAADNNGHVFVVSTNGTGAGTLSVISTATNTLLPGTAATGSNPFSVAVNQVNGQIAVTNNGDSTLGQYTFNGATFTQTGTVALPPDPKGVTFTIDGQSAYAVSQQTGTVTQVDSSGASTASDRVAPAAAISSSSGYYPAGGSITGTATDDASGVGTVQVGFTPAGSATAPGSTVNAALSCANSSNLSCTWTAALPSGDGSYKAWARAVDRNRDSSGPNIGAWATVDNIIEDSTSPVVAITSPSSTSILVAGQTQVAGTATDNLSGVSAVSVTFTATTLGTTETAPATVSCDGPRTTCTWTVTTPSTLTPGTYNVQAQATDRAGNRGQSNVVVFTVGV